MLSFTLTDLALRPHVNSNNKIVIKCNSNCNILPDQEILINTGVILKFLDQVEFLHLDVAEDIDDNILIVNRVVERSNEQLVLKVKNISNEEYLIGHSQPLCIVHVMHACELHSVQTKMREYKKNKLQKVIKVEEPPSSDESAIIVNSNSTSNASINDGNLDLDPIKIETESDKNKTEEVIIDDDNVEESSESEEESKTDVNEKTPVKPKRKYVRRKKTT